jgi:hypothetical protein
MRTHSIALAAAAFAALAAPAAEARSAFSGHRVGGSATAERSSEGRSIIEALAAFLTIGVSAKAAPIAGGDAPRSATGRIEPCEEEKRRNEAKAAETRRIAEAEKAKARGGEPLYLAF